MQIYIQEKKFCQTKIEQEESTPPKKKKNLPATPQSETPESRVEERKKKHSHIISLTMLIFIFFSFFSLWVKAKLKATVSK